jgi:transcription antitermination factor NusB
VSSLATERRAARERALGLLSEAEVKGRPAGEVVDELPVAPDPFAAELVVAVEQHRHRIDELISRYARGWSIDRMPALDRAALRMGAAELITRADVPTGVVLAETVELASRFSTDGSGRFVNGLLARLARELRGDGAGPVPSSGETDTRARTADGLVIDLDGVIRHWDAEGVRQLEADLGVPAGTLSAAALEPSRLERAMDGRLQFEDWCREAGEELARAHGVDADLAAEAWASTPWRIDLDVIDLVRAVRRGGTPVALLSNASSRLVEDLERSGIDGEFDAVISSADLGITKPDPEAFRSAAHRLGVPAERCLFVDDVEANVAGAAATGMRAHRFEDVDQLRVLLGEAGLLP